MQEEKPIMIYHKKADECLNRIVIPKPLIDKFDRFFYMEVYNDKIVLKPMKKADYRGR